MLFRAFVGVVGLGGLALLSLIIAVPWLNYRPNR